MLKSVETSICLTLNFIWHDGNILAIIFYLVWVSIISHANLLYDFFFSSDVEECQLSECGGEGEMGEGDNPLPRSSSTSDITQQLTESFPGINIHTHTRTHLTLEILPYFGLGLHYMKHKVYYILYVILDFCMCWNCRSNQRGFSKYKLLWWQILDMWQQLRRQEGNTHGQSCCTHPFLLIIIPGYHWNILENNIVSSSCVQTRFWFGGAAVQEILTTQERQGLWIQGQRSRRKVSCFQTIHFSIHFTTSSSLFFWGGFQNHNKCPLS